MTIGLVGRKCGMTRVFTEDGAAVPVTVIEVLPNRVTRVLTAENNGYSAVQVTTGKRSPARLGKAVAGSYAKAGVEPGEGLWEFRATPAELAELQPGAELKADRFQAGQYVDGLRDGFWVYWNEDGSKTAEGRFERDQEAGDWTYYGSALPVSVQESNEEPCIDPVIEDSIEIKTVQKLVKHVSNED